MHEVGARLRSSKTSKVLARPAGESLNRHFADLAEWNEVLQDMPVADQDDPTHGPDVDPEP